VPEITVVLIEDHDLTRVELRTALQGQVRVIGETANGTKGLKLLESLKPDIAVVDIDLPDMDGIEVTRLFKNLLAESDDAELQKTKVMILTMQDSEDSVLAAFAAGADSYCMKDFNLDRLLEVLRVTNEGKNWIDPMIAHFVLQPIRQLQPASGDGKKNSLNYVTISVDAEYSQVIEAHPLTEQELKILELIVAGDSNAAIAEKLYITVGTVKTHVRTILNKLCADDRTQAAVRALRSGLVG
jgi:DNA-binding NarL/FixJ family response regulator